jgi:O-acetyl-ADP-ribose deacetylase (regulator of RNase III)
MLSIHNGNLFENINPNKKTYIMHVVNNLGYWGSGFVLQINKYLGNKAEIEYKNTVNTYNKQDLLGGFIITEYSDKLFVVGLFAMNGIYDKYNNPNPLIYAYLSDALMDSYDCVDGYDCEVLMPKIGVGLANGDWAIIEPMIQRHATVETKIYTL